MLYVFLCEFTCEYGKLYAHRALTSSGVVDLYQDKGRGLGIHKTRITFYFWQTVDLLDILFDSALLSFLFYM